MFPFDPPPNQGPVMSIVPSGRRGIGWLFTSLSATTGLAGAMCRTCSCAWTCATMPTAAAISNSRFMFVSSETVLHAELHDARIALLSGDAAELAGSEVGRRVAPHETVKEVERLDAQLEVLGAAKPNQPPQRQVHAVPVGRPDVAVSRAGAD